MKPYQLFSLLTLPIILAAACNQKKENPKPFHPIADQQLTDAANIQTGSYFVYADSASGATDSFYCNKYNHSTVTNITTWHTWEDYETESCNLQSANGSYINYYAQESSLALGFVLGKDTGYGYCLYTPFLQGQSYMPVSQDRIGTAYAYHDSLSVSGRMYYSVYHYANKSFRRTTTDTVYSGSYYSIPSGMIKYTVKSKKGYHAWELLRSHIVR
jgi:hypothetical protein